MFVGNLQNPVFQQPLFNMLTHAPALSLPTAPAAEQASTSGSSKPSRGAQAPLQPASSPLKLAVSICSSVSPLRKICHPAPCLQELSTSVRLLRVITGLGLVSEVGLETYHALPATHIMASPMIRAAHQHLCVSNSPTHDPVPVFPLLSPVC